LNWSAGDDTHVVKYIDYVDFDKENWNWYFKPFHQHYVPVGSVEFVLAWMKRFNIATPKPMNVPEELFDFVNRGIFNGPHYDMDDILDKRFVKSNDHIKGFKLIIDNTYPLPEGNYQFSEVIDIESEWRCFVHKGKLVGLQNYAGEFDMFPCVDDIKCMIDAFKSAPIAYTLDVGVHDERTFVIECHDFFSCGLYGFTEHKIYPYMLYRWFHEYKIKNKV